MAYGQPRNRIEQGCSGFSICHLLLVRRTYPLLRFLDRVHSVTNKGEFIEDRPSATGKMVQSHHGAATVSGE